MATPAPNRPDRQPRVAVVGHIEWVDFVSLPRYPREGELLAASDWSARVGGGGGVAAGVLADLGAQVDFFLALGRDAEGEAAVQELRERGVQTHVAWRAGRTRRAITYLTAGGERTIVTIGERLEPLGSDDLEWDLLRDADGVYFTAGDTGTLARARAAHVLTASPRGRDAFGKGATSREQDAFGQGAPSRGQDAVGREAGTPRLDALIFSDEDADERQWADGMRARANLMVATQGSDGGHWWGSAEGRWDPVPAPGKPQDAYGCGDSFAAAFTYGLATGRTVAEAAHLGAERGAYALTRVGAP